MICCHIGSGTKTPKTSDDAPEAVAGTIIFGNSVGAMADYLYSGVFLRYPNLKVLLPSARSAGSRTCWSGSTTSGRPTGAGATASSTPRSRPSTMYRDHVFSTFFKDAVGVALLDRSARDNVIFETDYPHQDGTWPYSGEQAAEQFAHLDQRLIYKLARGNAIRLLGLKL